MALSPTKDSLLTIKFLAPSAIPEINAIPETSILSFFSTFSKRSDLLSILTFLLEDLLNLPDPEILTGHLVTLTL